MGLFGAVSSILKEKAYINPIAKVANLALTAITHPIGFLTNTKSAYEKTSKTNLIGLEVAGVTNTLVALAPFSVPIRSTAVKIIAGASTKTKVIAGTGALITAGALVSKPKETILALENAPSSIGNFLGNAGGLVADPSISKAKELISENPLVAGAVAVGGALAIGGIASNVINTLAVKENTRATIDSNKELAIGTNNQTTSNANAPPTDLGISTIAPERPTTNLTTARKRYKRAKKEEVKSMNQRVNVLINNRSIGSQIQNKRYLKVGAYA